MSQTKKLINNIRSLSLAESLFSKSALFNLSYFIYIYRLNKTMNREISQLAGTIDDLRKELSDLREREELLEAAAQCLSPIKRSASSISRTSSANGFNFRKRAPPPQR